MNLNIDAIKGQTFDAIVIGSGISGGWAAKELTEKGLKLLPSIVSLHQWGEEFAALDVVKS